MYVHACNYCTNYLIGVPAKKDCLVIVSVSLCMRIYTGSSPVNQLSCVGGACREYTPSSVMCRNVGSDGVDAQWKCEADMPSEFKFGRVQVTCEGYEYPEDPYVLAGSCGLEYTIDRVRGNNSRGRRDQYQASNSNGYRNYGSQYNYGSSSSYSSSQGSTSGGLFAVAILLFVFFTVYRSCNEPRGSTDMGGGGGGGGGGGAGLRGRVGCCTISCHHSLPTQGEGRDNNHMK